MQVTSIVMIVVFFVVLRRSDRRDEVDWWVAAWTANLVALTVTLFFWYVEPGPRLMPLVRALYLGGKTAFVLLLIQGAWSIVRPGEHLLPPRRVASALGVYAVVGAATLTTVPLVGVAQHVTMGALLLAGGAALAVTGLGSVTWLVAGLLIRGVLSLVEAAAYWTQARTPDVAGSQLATFLAAHSSFDTAAEWLIVLGCVLALSERAQRELRKFNEQLLVASEGLRQLADRDPLTALANRRALPEVFRAVQPHGATVLFFDLDDFKRVNDRYGHAAGDESLRRFSAALRESFRPQDAVLRYGGDEFLVVAGGMDRLSALQRVRDLQGRLDHAGRRGLRLTFSVGMGELRPGGQPDAALRAADAAMYQAKRPAPDPDSKD